MAALTVVIVVALFLLQSMVRSYSEATTDIFADQGRFQRLALTMSKAVAASKNYVVFGNAANYEGAVREANKALNSARLELTSSEERDIYQQIRDRWERFNEFGDLILAAPDRSDGSVLLLIERQDAQRDALLEAFTDMHTAFNHKIAGAVARTHAKDVRIMVALGVIFLAIFLGSMFTGLGFIRSVAVPLQALEAATQQMESGDLSQRLAVETDDEFGRVAHRFNAMADRLSGTMERLADLSRRDSVTGLFNRREFDTRLETELERGRRYKHRVSLLLLDLNLFKQVNDRYGHPTGDAALRHLAATIQHRLRATDGVFRTGGDEFAIILPMTDGKEARELAADLRALVKAQPLALPDRHVGLNISVGVATFPDHNTAEALVAAADASLYYEKAFFHSTTADGEI